MVKTHEVSLGKVLVAFVAEQHVRMVGECHGKAVKGTDDHEFAVDQGTLIVVCGRLAHLDKLDSNW
jgi:hypothetical protein